MSKTARNEDFLSTITTIKNLHEILGADCIGGDFNSDVSVFEKGNKSVILSCWDGRRFRLTLEKLPKGCKYDANTGKPILTKR